MAQSLSRQLASFATSLSYSDLPPAVIDKLKGLILHGLVMSIVGAGTSDGRATVALIKSEEGREDGASILVDGSKVTRGGAAFANSKLMHITNQSDSYRMLTHPGPHILPAAFASAELEGRSGRELLTALAAAYEVGVRIPGDFIPTTQARGFRSSPVYGGFGAAVVTAKLLHLDEDQITTAIALAATFAGGTCEGPRTEGQEMKFHEPNAARNGVMAGILARENLRGAETALEGDAGFYNAFTGNNRGELSYVFEGDTNTKLGLVTEGLGERYELLNVTPKLYPAAGYNNPVIELMAKIKADHQFDPVLIEGIDLEMNWLETLYPSPAFPNPARGEPGPGSTHHYLAYTCVHGGFPLVGAGVWQTTGQTGEDPLVSGLMNRITITGRKDLRTFAPRITVRMQNGSSFTEQMTGEELKWDLATEVHRIREVFPSLPVSTGQLEQLISTIERLEELEQITSLIQLTIPTSGARS